jgi:hypothetical protein
MLHTVQDMHIMYYALVAVLEKASAMRGGGYCRVPRLVCTGSYLRA